MEDWSSFYNLLGQLKERSKEYRNPFKDTNKKMVCIKEIESFTVGKDYRLIGCAGEFVQLKDNNGDEVILYESYFR